MQQAGEIDGLPFPEGRTVGHSNLDELGMTNDLLQALHTDLAEVLTHLLSQEGEVVHDIFCTALEVLAQFWVLGGHTHGTGIRIAFTHHHTTQYDERQRTKRELVGTQHRHHNHVFGSLQLTVGLQAHLIAQTVDDQCLLRLCQTYLGRDASETHA